MLQAVVWIAGVGLLLGLLIGIANKFFEVKEDPLVIAVYDLLPHFNCGACGTPGCLANAKEIVFNNQPLESCKPGNQQMRNTIKKVMDDYKSGKLTFGDDDK
jgi:electron transport complex protein RnfB